MRYFFLAILAICVSVLPLACQNSSPSEPSSNNGGGGGGNNDDTPQQITYHVSRASNGTPITGATIQTYFYYVGREVNCATITNNGEDGSGSGTTDSSGIYVQYAGYPPIAYCCGYCVRSVISASGFTSQTIYFSYDPSQTISGTSGPQEHKYVYLNP
jgi:hypothetical protein